MKRTELLLIAALGAMAGCATQPTSAPAAAQKAAQEDVTEKIIAMERAALDRWGKGDPSGYLEIYAPEITYFDPSLDARKEGFEAMKAYYEPLKGKIAVSRYDMIKPKVQRYGEAAVLSFQLISYGAKPSGGEQVLARWNSTEVYRLIGADWRIAHNHWSFIQPELRWCRRSSGGKIAVLRERLAASAETSIVSADADARSEVEREMLWRSRPGHIALLGVSGQAPALLGVGAQAALRYLALADKPPTLQLLQMP